MAYRTNKYIIGQFWIPVNPKDRFVVEDCEDILAKQVLEFLILILYPEKPTQVTVTVGNTIFGVLMEDKPVDSGLLLYDVVGKQVGNVGKGKPTIVCPLGRTLLVCLEDTRAAVGYFWGVYLPPRKHLKDPYHYLKPKNHPYYYIYHNL